MKWVNRNLRVRELIINEDVLKQGAICGGTIASRKISGRMDLPAIECRILCPIESFTKNSAFMVLTIACTPSSL